ncbi:hypothetical protein FA13DRAFT_1784713 [Coprinellus micaceus]|uniref:Uncharacterized protein n=1 Tax=Coprinellus micaceus TaxID=71717 RepID=A0A4Y7U1I3_COPMI|nr:hypothetical protein FA13DRAFT_1784713 [Coprinellus micaceus]
MKITPSFVLAALSSLAVAAPQAATLSTTVPAGTAISSTISTTLAPITSTFAAVPADGTATVTVTKLIYPAGLPEEYIAFLLGYSNSSIPDGTATAEPFPTITATSVPHNTTIPSTRSSSVRPSTRTFSAISSSAAPTIATSAVGTATTVTASGTIGFPQPDITAYPPPCGFVPGSPPNVTTFTDFPTATSSAGSITSATTSISTDSGIFTTVAEATPANGNFTTSTAVGTFVSTNGTAFPIPVPTTAFPSVCIPYTTTEIAGFPTVTAFPTGTTIDSSTDTPVTTSTIDASEPTSTSDA